MSIAPEVELSPHEAALIKALAGRPATFLDELAATAGLELAQARSAIERLKMKDAVEQVAEEVSAAVVLSDKGVEYAERGMPELRLWATLEQGPAPISALQKRDDMDKAEAGAAFGALKKAKVLELNKGQASLVEGADRGELDARQAFLASLSDGATNKPLGGLTPTLSLDELSEQQQAWIKDKRLKACFKVSETKNRSYALTELGAALTERAAASDDEVAQLSSEMLRERSWEGKRFRRYAIGKPPRLIGGARNGYRAFFDKVRGKLVALGFEEMRGSLVDNEFWTMDALFMPQFHPAREIHDVYFVEEPSHAKEVAEPHLSNVAQAHEGGGATGTKGWGYEFDRERTRRLILRSQGTVLSARTVASAPKIPGKYFSTARCFRYDDVDATHAPDFFQLEGIVLGERISLRHLLGLLKLFASEIAEAKEIRAVPAYFPFTEPSVEVHIKHPTQGWMEMGGAGIFRPEVSKSLGVDCPVIAWGLGLDRMAMVALGVEDIRHLFTNNLPRGLADTRKY